MPVIPSPHPGVALAGEFQPDGPGHAADLAAFVAAAEALQAKHGIPCLLVVRERVGARERLYLVPAGDAPPGMETAASLASSLRLDHGPIADALEAEPEVDWAAAIAAADSSLERP